LADGETLPNKALELTGRRSACQSFQLPAAGHGGVGYPGRLTGVRPMGRGTFTGRQLNALSVGRLAIMLAARPVD
jgi:hypothetical protein